MEATIKKSLTDVILEVREKFERSNGRLLTVEEAIALTEEARRETRKEKESIYEKN